MEEGRTRLHPLGPAEPTGLACRLLRLPGLCVIRAGVPPLEDAAPIDSIRALARGLITHVATID